MEVIGGILMEERESRREKEEREKAPADEKSMIRGIRGFEKEG